MNFLFKDQYDIRYTPTTLESGGSQYEQITSLIKNCAFGVVILDGFRPNVIWEYGVMVGCNKKLILLMGNGANVDMSTYDESTPETPGIPDVPIKMDKHLSNVKDRFRTGCDLSQFDQVLKILTEEARKKNLLV